MIKKVRNTQRALSLLILIGFVDLNCATNARAQYIWEAYEDNPVFNWDLDQSSTFMFRPAILKKDGRYHMWYGKQVGFPSGPRSVGYATSEDGIEWVIENLFVLEPSGVLGTFDQLFATNASVVDEGDTLKMWYNGVGQLSSGIGYAWSVNGTDWTKVRGPGSGGSVFDTAMDGSGLDGVVSPTVVALDGVYNMWYQKLVSFDGRSRIGYATSGDGLNWTVTPGPGVAQSVVDVGAPGAFDADQLWWPWVLHNSEKGIYEMWYQGGIQFGTLLTHSLGCARSEDGVTWEKVTGDGDAEACRNSLAQPAVILDDGIYKMWYTLTTGDSPNNDVVLYATSDPLSTRTEIAGIPNRITSLHVFPNPSSGQVGIQIESRDAGEIMLEIVDTLGRCLHVERSGNRPPGVWETSWGGLDESGRSAAAGLYFLRAIDTGGDNVATIGFQIVR